MPATVVRAIPRQHQITSLSPRLQQAVRLLQMSSLDFAQAVADAVGNNPFVETDDVDEAALSPALARLSAPYAADAPSAGQEPAADAAGVAEAPADAPPELPPEAGLWNDGSTGTRSSTDPTATAMDFAAAPNCLNAHLHGQLNLLPLPARDMALAKALVESLDDDGYLRADPLELLAATDLDPAVGDDEARIALRRVQSLDPAGVGARNVQECLLLQAAEIECPRQRALALRIIGEHMKQLAAHETEQLAHQLRRGVAEVEAVCARIRRFDPRPGWRFGAPPARYITPDVIARRYRGRWVALLNPAVLPRLRLNTTVVDLFRQHAGARCSDMAEQLQEARWTMRNVEQRFSTIVNVAQAILDRQSLFLDYGEMAMKPLSLREIAERLGMHESTVSRVTNNKYLATPAGVFELKRFFSRAMVMPSGVACSPTAIRGLMRDLIASETPRAPLSDAQITQLLAQQGLRVARRTITKYRQALHIEPAGRRRAAA